MTVTVLVATCAVALAFALAAWLLALARADADRRRQALLADVADDLALASRKLARALDRIGGARARELQVVGPSLTIAQVLDGALTAAVEQTGADATAIRVDGPSGATVTAFRGGGVDDAGLDATLAATGSGAFRAATIRWSYDPYGGDAGGFRTATLVPILEDDRVTGALVAYASGESAFGPAEERALRGVADQTATLLAAARRYEELELRYLTDPPTGIRNRSAFEIDLEREIDRSRASGGPLSIVVVEVEPPVGRGVPEPESRLVAGVARAFARASRGDDVVYRRRERQLAALLRGTDSAGASVVATRLQAAARSVLESSGGGRVSIGAVQWRSGETRDSLDGRASAALEAAPSTSVRSSDIAQPGRGELPGLVPEQP